MDRAVDLGEADGFVLGPDFGPQRSGRLTTAPLAGA